MTAQFSDSPLKIYVRMPITYPGGRRNAVVMISGSEVNHLVATHLRGTTGTPASPAGQTARPAAAGADGVTLSPQSASVTRLLKHLQSLPEIRQDRVEEVRGRLAAGTQPSSHDVAKQILQRVVGDHLAAGG